MRKLFLSVFFSVLLALLMPSCGSHRHSSVRGGGEVRNEGIGKNLADEITAEAKRWIGTPYRHGKQKRRSGTDCSGMVMVIYEEKTGVRLPRRSSDQQKFCKKIDKDDLAPGDLVFFSPSKRGGRVSHVGIYIGRGEFIHASSSKGVMVSRLDQKYFVTHFHSAGRVPLRGHGGRSDRCESVAAESAPRKNSYNEIIARAEITLDSLIVLMSDSIAQAERMSPQDSLPCTEDPSGN